MSGATSTPFIADPTDPLLGWASTTELALSQQLHDVDFAVQIDITSDQLEKLDKFYGLFLGRQLRAGADLDTLVDATPALAAITLVGRAGRLADLSNFEAEYISGLGLDPELLPGEAYFTKNLSSILAAAGLDPMDIAAEGPDDDLGRLLLHALIPAGWIPDLISYIDSSEQELTGETITSYYAQEMPTRQLGPLCTLLPQAAADLFDQVIALYRWIGEHLQEPHSWGTSPAAAHIPTLIMEDVVDELRERPAGTVDRLSTVGTAAWEFAPRLVYDTTRERVVLRLPQLPLSDDITELRWHVSIDGDISEYRLGLDQDTEGLSEYLDIPIRKAAREINITEVVRRHTWTLPVLTEPFLAFTSRGQDVTRKQSWHHSELILVIPDDAVVVDFSTAQPLPTSDTVELRGWNGWVACVVDLTQASSVHISRPGDPAGASPRAVDPRQRVTFVEDGRLEFVRSDTGLTVHNRSLMAEFPPTVSGTTETWYLSVSSYAGPGRSGIEVTPMEPLEVPAEGGVFYVFDPDLYDSPWVGEYIVRLRGPRNESFRHRYAIVEGLSTTLDNTTSFRIPTAGGLSPITVKLATEKPSDINPNPAPISPESDRAAITISTAEGDLLPLRITPPRLRFQVPLKGEEARWRSTPLTCAGSELNGDMFLRVRSGADITKPVITARDHHGNPVRTKKMITWDGLTWRVPLAEFARALAVQTGGRIELSWVDEVTRQTMSVRLVTLAPTPEFTVELDEDGSNLLVSAPDSSRDATSVIRHEGAPDGRPLGLWIWPTTAPWRRALTVRVIEGKAQLPAELRKVGPLAVQVFCADLSEDLRAPARPGPQALTVEQEGYATGQGLDSLSAFLAGETKTIEGSSELFTLLWDLQSGWMSDTHALDNLAKGNELVREAFLSHPTPALSGLSKSLVDRDSRPGLLISSGLVRSAFGSEVAQDAATPWIRALGLLSEAIALKQATDSSEEDSVNDDPMEAALTGAGKKVAARKIGQAASQESTDQAEITGSENGETDAGDGRSLTDVLAELESAVGHRAVEAFSTGRDQSLENACLDRNTVHIAQMPDAQQEVILKQFLDAAGIVPGPMSDDNSRLLAVLETFKWRAELNELLGNQELMVTAAQLLKKVRNVSRQLYAAARVRFDRLEGVDTESDGNRWALAPIVSLVFALAARVEAHGGGMGGTRMGELSSGALAGWAKIAEMLPDLVAGDILAADAMVLGVIGHRIPAVD